MFLCPSGAAHDTCHDTYALHCLLTLSSVNGAWSSWLTSDTGSCSVTCGLGTRVRTDQRHCNNPAPTDCGAACPGNNKRSEFESCNAGCCPGMIRVFSWYYTGADFVSLGVSLVIDDTNTRTLGQEDKAVIQTTNICFFYFS